MAEASAHIHEFVSLLPADSRSYIPDMEKLGRYPSTSQGPIIARLAQRPAATRSIAIMNSNSGLAGSGGGTVKIEPGGPEDVRS